MNRVLVALSAICLPMLSVAAPPITEPVDVNVTNPVLPVEVSNADPILVTDPFAAGGTPIRFGPVSYALPDSTAGGQILVPLVPTGKVFVATWLNVNMASNTGAALTSASCQFFLTTSSTSRSIVVLPLTLASSSAFGNLALSLPLNAGEGMNARCSFESVGTYATAQIIASGYFVPAAN